MSNIFNRINDALTRRLNEQVEKGKGRGGNTDQTRAIGTRSTLNGKTVYWSGQNYGWQTKGSHEKLKESGAFRVGQQNLQRIGNDISTTASRAWNNTPKPVRDAAVGTAKVVKKELWDNQPKVVKGAVKGTLGAVDKGLEAVSKATNTSRFITDEAVTALATLGAGVAVKHGGKTLGRIGQAVARRVDDIPTPVTRQAAGRGVANRIQRRLDDAAAARRAQDAGRVSTGAPGSLDPKVRGGRRPINPNANAPKPPSAADKLEALYTDIEALSTEELIKRVEAFPQNRKTATILDTLRTRGGGAENLNLAERDYISNRVNIEYHKAADAAHAAHLASKKPKVSHKAQYDLPGARVKEPLTATQRRYYPELAERENRIKSRLIRRRKAVQNGDEQFLLDATAPIAEAQTVRRPNGGVLPERFEADKAPKKGDPITRNERESIDRLNARVSGRQLTKTELAEKRRLEKFIRDNKAGLTEPRKGIDGLYRYPTTWSPTPEQLAELDKVGGMRSKEALALSTQHFEKAKAVNEAVEALDRLKSKQLGRNSVEVKQGRSTRIVDRLKRNPDLDPKQVGVTKARQNTIEAAERNASKGRIALATRRRMTKESRGRLSPYDQYNESSLRRSGTIYDKPEEILAPGDVYAIEGSRFGKHERIRKRLRDIERTEQYRAHYNKTIPKQEFDKVQAELRKRATDEWHDNSYGVQDLYKSEATYVRSHSSRKQVEAEIKFRRHREYMKKHGVFDEARFDERLIPKTDNPAGKESIKHQFREARRRRGMPDAREKLRDLKDGRATEVRMTGDTRYRGLSRRQPNGSFGGSANPSKRDNLARPLNGRTPTKADKDVQKLNKRFQGISPLKPSREAVAPVQGAKRSVPPTDPADRKPGSYKGRIRRAVERSVPAKPTRREASVLRPTGIANKARQRAMDHGYPTRTELRKQKRIEETLLKIKLRRLKEKNQGS